MIRLIALFILSLVFLILILQNLQTVRFNFLFWSFESSLALFALITSVITVLLGIAVLIPFGIKKVLDNMKERNKVKLDEKKV